MGERKIMTRKIKVAGESHSENAPEFENVDLYGITPIGSEQPEEKQSEVPVAYPKLLTPSAPPAEEQDERSEHTKHTSASYEDNESQRHRSTSIREAHEVPEKYGDDVVPDSHIDLESQDQGDHVIVVRRFRIVPVRRENTWNRFVMFLLMCILSTLCITFIVALVRVSARRSAYRRRQQQYAELGYYFW